MTRELLIERERTLTVRLANAPASIFCAECRTERNFISIAQAAVLRQMSDRRIFRLVENGRLHHSESAAGRMLVCLFSLQAFDADDDDEQSK